MPLGTDLFFFLLEVGWPVVVFIIGAIAMHKTGMLPQQQRLEHLLKDTIAAQEAQLDLRDTRVKLLEERIVVFEREATAVQTAHDRTVLSKDQTIEALQSALAREQSESKILRADVADNQIKLNALIAISRAREEGKPS